MKRFKRVISFVLTMALILPILPIPEVQADDTETALTGQVSVVKSGNGEGTITVDGSDIGESFEQEYAFGDKVKIQANAKDGSRISNVKLTVDGNEENVSKNDMMEYSNTVTVDYDKMVVEVSFEKVESDSSVDSTESKTETTEDELNTKGDEDTDTDTSSDTQYVGVSPEEAEAYQKGLIPERMTSNPVTRKGDTVIQEYGTNALDDVCGVSRDSVMNILRSKVSSNFYLSTPYVPDDWRNPNGDPAGYGNATPGVPGMNCTGFVWHLLTSAGGRNIPGINGWVTFLEQNNIKYRTYTGSNINDVIDTINHEDKWVEPGDVIWMWDANAGGMQNGLSHGLSFYHHIGIYVGNTMDNLNPYNGWYRKVNGDVNGLWHSTEQQKWGMSGNMISNILPKTVCTSITVVKTSDKPKKGGLSITKKPQDLGITSGNPNYSLEGAIYGIYKDSNCSQEVKSITTNKDGYAATLDGELDYGTYYVKEKKASSGFDLDPKVYTCTINNSQSASLNRVYSTEPLKFGKIKVEKTSSKPDVTNGNDNYSLKGAEYSIYKDQKCTNYVNKIVTDENGKGSLGNLPLGVYYVKETKASPGYNKDPQVYKVNISSGQAAVIEGTVKSKEVPLLDPVSILLRKVDSDTGKPNASLAGAQFRVKYYTKIMDTDPALSGQKPARQWVFKTDSDGYLGYDKDHFVSGDAFYLDANGKPSLPYGTLTFEEIKAPEGYHVNSKIIVAKIPKDSNNSGTIVYQEPTQLENAIKLKLKKVHNGTSKPISGAVFSHINPDGTMESLTTDRNGQIEIKGLKKGNHTIQETSVPDGYAVNKNKITFTVDDSGKIKITSDSTETNTDGTIVLNVNKDGDLEATVNEKPAPFDFKIVKASNKGNKLAGAEFTLYSDKDCKTEVGKQVSGKDGVLKFEDLIVGKMYYMKETKAPEGYRIPVNSDGSDIVYTIKVNSVPVDNVFTVEFNGKVYDSSSGDIVLEGTKADRVVTANIINKAGMKLPETGSSDMIFIMLMGVGFMVLGLKRRTVK